MKEIGSTECLTMYNRVLSKLLPVEVTPLI
jgi:hypothetical protein